MPPRKLSIDSNAPLDRRDAPGDHVVDRLIGAAELLYGRHGIDAVSLRQVSLAAGSGNNNAVQYHFGDGEGLIRAILAKRTPELEQIRRRMFEQAEEQAMLSDVRTLMDLIYRPMIDYRNARGERAYARFLLELHTWPGGSNRAGDYFHMMPFASRAIELLHATHPWIPLSLMYERHRLLAIMVLTSVFNRRAPFDGDEHDAQVIENALTMATAAVLAWPVPTGSPQISQ